MNRHAKTLLIAALVGVVGMAFRVSWNALALGSSTPSEPDYEDLLKHLLTWEGMVRHMYLDKYGYVTVGIGNLLKTVEAAKQLPFVNGDTHQPASAAESREKASLSQAGGVASFIPPRCESETCHFPPTSQLRRRSTWNR